jgi:hypothetical protein
VKKGYVAISILALSAMAVSAFGWGSLVSSFSAPSGTQYLGGLGYRDTCLYVATVTPNRCYRTTRTGLILASHNLPTLNPRGCAAGVIGSNGYYWVVSYNPNVIYRMGYSSGSVVNSFAAPGGNGPRGLAFRASGSSYYLYYTEQSGSRLYRMNATTGSVYASYSLSFNASEVAYDPAGYLWMTDPTAVEVKKCTLTGSVLDSFSVSGHSGSPLGCTFDGLYVWVGISRSSGSRILQYEVESGTGIKPASFGKIKTVFR